MGGLVVKQMLYQAKNSNLTEFVKNTIGVVCIPCHDKDTCVTWTTNNLILSAGVL